ncbi:MAG: hypothetical protein KJ042_16125 [Deltaproteobacteria bacterium]|nr:hypothetical protein [Deltaproteobacteria bacterium]
MPGPLEVFLKHDDVTFLKKHLVLDTRLERLLRQGQRQTDGITIRGTDEELQMLDELIGEQIERHDAISDGLERVSNRVRRTLAEDFVLRNKERISEEMAAELDEIPVPAEEPEDIEACLIVITPRAPAIEWARTIADADFTTNPEAWGKSAYLISYAVHRDNFEEWLRESFEVLFENELLPFFGGQDVEPPTCESVEMFREWFDVELVQIVYDVRPIEEDDLDDLDDLEEAEDLDDDDDDDDEGPHH